MQPASCQRLLVLLVAVGLVLADPSRRLQGEPCVDVTGWKDSENYTCDQYRNNSWCTADGRTGSGWEARWNVLETYWHNGHSALSACCVCGGGQVSHIDGMWQVVRGPCTVHGECVQSPNYPGNYSDDQRCLIVVNSSLAKPLKVVHWDVEYWFDYLHINGKFYSGRTSPEGQVPSGHMHWSTDEDTNGTGWKLCASDEVAATTSAATTSTQAAAVTEVPTTSSSSSAPASPAPPAPCRDVEGWTDLGDFSCGDYSQRQWCTTAGSEGPSWDPDWGSLEDYWRKGYAAGQACCACGGGQTESILGAWQVLRGECKVVDSCIQSPNYPANYSNNERCTIVTNSTLMTPLQMVDFNTERFYDVLTINNMQFSGYRKPSGISPRGTIAWRSDDDTPAKGWKLCLGPKLTPPAGGGIFTVLEGSCSIDSEGCALSPNYPAEYGPLQGCIIQVYNPQNKTVVTRDFATESGYDVLWVNGRRYSGSIQPDGLVPTEPIQWSSDEDIQAKGWKLCPGPVGQPGAGVGGALEDYGYGDDDDEDGNGDGFDEGTATTPATGFIQGSNGMSEDSQSVTESPSEDKGPEINGTLPFGKIFLATSAICLAGVLIMRCRRSPEKGFSAYSTSYGRSYAMDNL